MKADNLHLPSKNYGVLFQDLPLSELDEAVEQVRRVGYATLNSGYSEEALGKFSAAFDSVSNAYIEKYGEKLLRNINEFHIIRALLTQGENKFIELATNKVLLSALEKLIVGKFILNQQNGIINPAMESYGQGLWHRDLPYQHFVSSTPLAINALFCIDDFTCDNGATYVLPSTHKFVNYPSDSYIKKNAYQLEAKAGQFILLDCMLFHSGGFNATNKDRRAINHVYTIPYFKQQIRLPGILSGESLSKEQREIFGFGFKESFSVDDYFISRGLK
jgi:ectoine hydroxylase-related dioxygenase (phytanoyl-CoA dioxygenase family)